MAELEPAGKTREEEENAQAVDVETRYPGGGIIWMTSWDGIRKAKAQLELDMARSAETGLYT